MVCPAFCTTHGLCYMDILPIPSPDNDVVYKMPVFAARVHPGRLVAVGKAKDCVCDEEIMCRTCPQQ